MAIYSANLKGFSREKGHSAVAGAAYRACEKIEEQETSTLHNYTFKRGLLHKEIVTPANVSVPDWATERGELWNNVHSIETAKNARLAREITLALPHELNDEQRAELAGNYAQWMADRHQVVCDFAIHAPDKNGDDRNYHMHMMMTAKQITEDGFRKTKSQTIDGKTVRFIPLDYHGTRGSAEVKAMREQAAHCMNEALEKAGSDARVDHRSYVDQELDVIPMIHLGKAATQLEREGRKTELGEKNRRIQDFNFINSVLPAGYALSVAANENSFEPLPSLTVTESAPEQAKVIPLFPTVSENVIPMRWGDVEEQTPTLPPIQEEPPPQGLFDSLKQHVQSMMDWVTDHARELREGWQLMEEEQAQRQQENHEHQNGWLMGEPEQQQSQTQQHRL